MPKLRATNLGLLELAAFAEAAVALTLASAAVRLLPFRWVVRSMGKADPVPIKGTAEFAPVRWAVKRASRRLPWRIVCFQEGLATHWLLRRRGLPSRLHYGIRQDGSTMQAHVWVTLGLVVVIGENTNKPHARVASFPDVG